MEQVQGILGGLFGQLGAAGVKTPPVLKDKTLTIVITEAELAAMATKGMQPQYQNAIKVAIKEGKIEMTVQLW